MKKLILPFLMAALMLPAATIACPGGPDWKRGGHFEKMDSNGDGVISVEEHEAFAAARFAEMDANGDGKLTRDEIRQQRQKYYNQRNKDCPMKKDCPAGKDCPVNQGA